MTYIVSPWIFYISSVVDGLRFISTICLILSLVTFIITGIAILADYDSDFPPDQVQVKVLKTSAIIAIIAAAFVILVPSRETVYEMMIANVATVENVSDVCNSITKAAHDMIVALKQ